MPNKYLDSVQLGRLVTKIKSLVSTTVANYLPLTGGSITGNLSVSGTITGDVTGDVTGNITGDVTGNITGNVTGNVTGDVTGTASGNLPLSGGTLTGEITTSATDFIVKGNNTGHLTIMGGTEYGNSASIRLAGGDETGQTGLFQLRSQDGVNSKDLIGKPSGELTWNGSNVAVMGTLQNGHGILSGSVSNISIAAKGYTSGSVSFGQTFANTPGVVAVCSYGHAHVYVGCHGVTTTGFNYMISSENSTEFSNEKISWIAIG